MSRKLQTIAVYLLLCAAAHAETWSRFSRPSDGFAVELPGAATEKPTEVAPSMKRHVSRAITYELAGRDFVFAVGVQRMKRAIDLDRVVVDSFATLGCADRFEPEPLPVQNARARELHGKNCLGGEFSATLRHYTRGLDVYQVLAIFHPARAVDARRFLDSFKLLGPALSSTSRRGKR